MIGVSTPGERQPRTLWLIARTFLLAKHEDVLDGILSSSINGLDIEYIPRLVLAIQGLTVPDFMVLRLCHPSSHMIADDEGGCMVVEDQQDSHAFEQTLGAIGSHLTFARLIIAEFALRNAETFRILEGKIAERPHVFEAGLQLLKGQTCRR